MRNHGVPQILKKNRKGITKDKVEALRERVLKLLWLLMGIVLMTVESLFLITLQSWIM